MTDFKRFKAEVKKALVLREWTYRDLSKATGYTVKTIEAFMSECKVTDNVACAIAKALDIPEYLAL